MTAAALLTAAEETVLSLIRAEELIALTTELVNSGGENPGGTEERTVTTLAAACRARSLSVDLDEVAPGRPNLQATLAGGSGPGLLFLGHSDVVPAGPGWSVDPFSAVLADGRLYGRGSTDMKGGLAAVLVAMNALREAGIPLAGPVQLSCTVDEEDLGLGIRALTARGTEQNFLGCVVAEPTDMETVIGCRGDSYLELRITGKAAHSGRPADGRNAIVAASEIARIVQADHHLLQQHQDPLLGAGSWNIGMIQGGQGTSMVAPGCTMWLDRRLMPGEDADLISDGLAEAIASSDLLEDGITTDLSVTMEMPGFSTDPAHPLVGIAVGAVTAAGGATAITGWTAACDGGFIARDFGVTTIVLGPGGLNDQAHQIDESVAVDELVLAARTYALMALRLLGV